MKRALFAVLGLGALAAVWLGPLEALAGGAFAAHMTVHMGVVAVAAPLLAFALAGSPFDPVRRAPKLFPPVPISLVELLVVWSWHAPALHHAARHSLTALAIEQSSFLIGGILVWLAAFGGDSAGRMQRGAAGVGALLLTSMHMTLLGALLALPPRPLYHHAEAHAHAALDDQHLGGAIMLIGGAVVYLAGGLWLSAQLLRGSRPPVRSVLGARGAP
jgi:putative membrane protein